MYPPTQKKRVCGCLQRPQTGVGRCLHRLQFWVGGGIHRLCLLGRRRPPPTLIFGSVDASSDSSLELVEASTDSKNIFWVGGCIHRLKKYSQRMHPPTLIFGSVDASTDLKNRVCGCIHRLSFWVGGCIHRLNN